MAGYVVKSKVGELSKKLGMRLSGKAIDELDALVEGALKTAAKRAEANKRKTIAAQDI
jgi:histone H3/H4